MVAKKVDIGWRRAGVGVAVWW